MASSKEYMDYVLDCLSETDGIGYRAMMGDYVVYYGGKVIGGVFDNRFLVKATDSAKALLPDAASVIPYPNAKPMLEIEDTENRELMAQLLYGMYDELPFPKKRSRK